MLVILLQETLQNRLAFSRRLTYGTSSAAVMSCCPLLVLVTRSLQSPVASHRREKCDRVAERGTVVRGPFHVSLSDSLTKLDVSHIPPWQRRLCVFRSEGKAKKSSSRIRGEHERAARASATDRNQVRTVSHARSYWKDNGGLFQEPRGFC